MIRYVLDSSPAAVVGICREPGCGVRQLAGTAAEARRQRAAHEERCHMKRGRQATRRRAQAVRPSSPNFGD